MRCWLPVVLLAVLVASWSLTSGCKREEGDGDADVDGDADTDGDDDAGGDADGDGDADADGDTDEEGDSGADADADRDGDRDVTDGDDGDDGDGDIDDDGDIDGDGDSEADSDIVDGDIETTFTSPVTGSVTSGCPTDEAQFGDIYSLEAEVGETIVVQGDTVGALTASNLAAFLFTDLDDMLPTYVVEGDDDVDCSFPPIFGRCPRFEWTVEPRHSGTFYIFISPGDACSHPENAEYQLTVTIGDDHTELELVRDEYALSLTE